MGSVLTNIIFLCVGIIIGGLGTTVGTKGARNG